MDFGAGSDVQVRQLRALVAVAEEGSFTDAAIRLGVTQPGVSRSIAALEELVGVRLVDRTTRTVELTDAGARAYAAAVSALAALAEVAPAARGEIRPLRLGYAWSALGRHTSGVLQRWRRAHPEVPLEVHRIDSIDAGIATGRTDVAVIRGPVRIDGVGQTAVLREARVAALPAGHQLASATAIGLADLSAETVLTTSYGTTTLQLWPEPIRPARSVHVDNTDEWLTEIAGGLGVGVTAESTATQHAHPGVAYVPLTDVPPVEVSLVWPARRPHPAVPAFCALVREVVAGSSAEAG